MLNLTNKDKHKLHCVMDKDHKKNKHNDCSVQRNMIMIIILSFEKTCMWNLTVLVYEQE